MSKIKTTTIVETIVKYEFTSDDIEEIIKEKYNLKDNVSFNWNIGQWVDLNMTVTNKETL